jgi:hypothetical protein
VPSDTSLLCLSDGGINSESAGESARTGSDTDADSTEKAPIRQSRRRQGLPPPPRVSLSRKKKKGKAISVKEHQALGKSPVKEGHKGVEGKTPAKTPVLNEDASSILARVAPQASEGLDYLLSLHERSTPSEAPPEEMASVPLVNASPSAACEGLSSAPLANASPIPSSSPPSSPILTAVVCINKDYFNYHLSDEDGMNYKEISKEEFGNLPVLQVPQEKFKTRKDAFLNLSAGDVPDAAHDWLNPPPRPTPSVPPKEQDELSGPVGEPVRAGVITPTSTHLCVCPEQ